MKVAAMPRVSVIIPNYNRASLVGETIRNMLAQTLPPCEIIVVDDGSTDNSVEVIRAFGSRVRLLQQTNRGPGAARNAGLAVASGEFVQFMDSDDLASRNKLEVQARVMERTGADFVYGPYVRGHIQPGVFQPEDVVLLQRPLPSRLSLDAWVLRGLAIAFQACLLRRSRVERLGGYRTDLMPSEDTELLFRMGLARVPIAFSTDCLTLYRLHSGGQITASGTQRGARLVDLARMRLCLEGQARSQATRYDPATRLCAATELWNTRVWLERLGVSQPDLARQLDRARGGIPVWACRLSQGVELLAQRSRLLWHRHRWKSFYQAAPLTPLQRSLLGQLGLQV